MAAPSAPPIAGTRSDPPGIAGRPATVADDLHLTGIAWQADPSARMAIINGLPVMAGTMIEAAEVIEIQPDRVLLRRQGVAIDLRLQE
jgi:hypothetical protein